MLLHAGRRLGEAVSVQTFDGVGWDFCVVGRCLDEGG